MITRRFAWIDLETTGLDPDKGIILEVACAITDHDLNGLDQFHAVIKPSLLQRMRLDKMMAPEVKTMHTNNRLLAELKNGLPIHKVENDFFGFLEPYRNQYNTELILTGNSIGSLDIPFIKKHMPSIMSQVHYRTLDISGLRIGLEQMLDCPGKFYLKSDASNHRALDDVARSIQQLRFYTHRLNDFVEEQLRYLQELPH